MNGPSDRINTSITLMPNGRWRFRYRDPRTRKWLSGGAYRTKGEAQQAEQKLLTEAGLVGLQDRNKGRMTLGEYAVTKFWPAEVLADKTRPQQLRLYRHYVEPRWGEVALADITVEDIEAWLGPPPGPKDPPARVALLRATPKRNGQGHLAHASFRQVYWIFHKIVAKAHERGYMARNPLPRKSGLGKVPPTKPSRALEPSEVHRLAEAIPGDDTLIYVMAYGGFRIGEVFALRHDDLDFRHNEIAVDESVIEIHETNTLRIDNVLKRPRAHRSVPMPQMVMDMLAQLPMGNRSDLLWTDSHGGIMRPSNWRRRDFYTAVKAAAVDRLTPHELRHTAASAWFDEGFDIVEVARFLGDSVAVAEQTYTHLFRGRRVERMAKMDDRIVRGRKEAAEHRNAQLPDGVVPLKFRRDAG